MRSEFELTLDTGLAQNWARLVYTLQKSDPLDVYFTEDAQLLQIHFKKRHLQPGDCIAFGCFLVQEVAPLLTLHDALRAKHTFMSADDAHEFAAALYGQLPPKPWSQIAAARLAEILVKHNRLDLIGFLRFRMNDLLRTLCLALQSLIRESRVRSRHKNYLDLLSTYAHINAGRAHRIDVYFQPEGKFVLRGAGDQSIPLGDPSPLSPADLLISLLVNLSPDIVALHSPKNANPPLLNTIHSIFGERISVMESE